MRTPKNLPTESQSRNAEQIHQHELQLKHCNEVGRLVQQIYEAMGRRKGATAEQDKEITKQIIYFWNTIFDFYNWNDINEWHPQNKTNLANYVNDYMEAEVAPVLFNRIKDPNFLLELGFKQGTRSGYLKWLQERLNSTENTVKTPNTLNQIVSDIFKNMKVLKEEQKKDLWNKVFDLFDWNNIEGWDSVAKKTLVDNINLHLEDKNAYLLFERIKGDSRHSFIILDVECRFFNAYPFWYKELNKKAEEKNRASRIELIKNCFENVRKAWSERRGKNFSPVENQQSLENLSGLYNQLFNMFQWDEISSWDPTEKEILLRCIHNYWEEDTAPILFNRINDTGVLAAVGANEDVKRAYVRHLAKQLGVAGPSPEDKRREEILAEVSLLNLSLNDLLLYMIHKEKWKNIVHELVNAANEYHIDGVKQEGYREYMIKGPRGGPYRF